jgi:hypothetical protein
MGDGTEWTDSKRPVRRTVTVLLPVVIAATVTFVINNRLAYRPEAALAP